MSAKKRLLQSAIVCSFLTLLPAALSTGARAELAKFLTDKLQQHQPQHGAGIPTEPLVQLAQADRRKRRSRKRTRRSSRRGAAAGAAGAAVAGSASASGGAAGRYAILRAENKDAGCLLSLNRSGRAQIGPGCQDHGIQIFDPVRWQISGGKIILRARGGHRISFARHPDGTWQRSPAGKTALGLKKY